MSSHSSSLYCYADEEDSASTAMTGPQQTVLSDNQQTVCPNFQQTPNGPRRDFSASTNSTTRPPPTLLFRCTLQPVTVRTYPTTRMRTRSSRRARRSSQATRSRHLCRTTTVTSIHLGKPPTTRRTAKTETYMTKSPPSRLPLRWPCVTWSVPLEREVKKLRQENIVLRWSNNNLVAAIQDKEAGVKDSGTSA